MATIYLIRHGQASFGEENYDCLSELGQRQSQRLGQMLSSRIPAFDAVCLGSMQRHRQTAEQCLKGFSQDLDAVNAVIDSDWNEYDHQEILARFKPEFASAASMHDYLRQQANPKQAFETGFNAAIDRWISGQHQDYQESWREFICRVHNAFEKVKARCESANTIAVFTSGGPISLLSQHLLGVPDHNIMRMNWTLMNCGVTKIVVTGSRVFIASLNEHTHFEGTENKHFITYS